MKNDAERVSLYTSQVLEGSLDVMIPEITDKRSSGAAEMVFLTGDSMN